MPTVYVGAGAAIAVAAAIAWWFHRSLTAASRPTATAGFLNTFSAERYRPMGLLLDEGEFRFLAGLPGYSKDLGRRFRRERVRIFRGYFARLKRDFHRLLDECGFETVRTKHFSLRDNPAGLVTSLAPGLDPMARRIRGVPEGPKLRLCRDLVYFAMVLASIPFTLLEAACRAGSTVMVEARRK